mmetsp:Transcript_11404/g.19520  ORF Transcript_11404/g.19520 Transcript_11404/m.19520 type:complete len:205 (-) Transcript_11404:1197-1811(-)
MFIVAVAETCLPNTAPARAACWSCTGVYFGQHQLSFFHAFNFQYYYGLASSSYGFKIKESGRFVFTFPCCVKYHSRIYCNTWSGYSSIGACAQFGITIVSSGTKLPFCCCNGGFDIDVDDDGVDGASWRCLICFVIDFIELILRTRSWSPRMTSIGCCTKREHSSKMLRLGSNAIKNSMNEMSQSLHNMGRVYSLYTRWMSICW